jgi:hypothetical protein
MPLRLVHLWGARAHQTVSRRRPSSPQPRRAAPCADGLTPGLPPLASTRAKVSRVGTPENSPPALCQAGGGSWLKC